MEGFLGVDRDGAPIMTPKMKPRNLGPKQEALIVGEIFNDEVPKAALTVHEIVEAVTEPSKPPGPAVRAGETPNRSGLRVLVQKEFESSPSDVEHTVATFRLTNPGKLSPVMVASHKDCVFGIFQPKCQSRLSSILMSSKTRLKH